MGHPGIAFKLCDSEALILSAVPMLNYFGKQKKDTSESSGRTPKSMVTSKLPSQHQSRLSSI